MSGHLDPWIACDYEGCNAQYPEDAGDGSFIDWTVAQLRKAAREDGWRCRQDGSDFCEDHATTPAALAPQRARPIPPAKTEGDQ